jgi:hypothetical protein
LSITEENASKNLEDWEEWAIFAAKKVFVIIY